MKYSTSKENYIKAIYHLQQEQDVVNTNALARVLETKPASVTDMLKKLKEQKLLQYQPYKGVKLTAEGKKLALLIIRKHRLWEYFLVSKLGFGWEEVHEIAEELEHISSKKLIDRLDDFLGNPRTDPHGDPIPDQHGKMPVVHQTRLLELPLNTPADVISVTNQSTEMLELLTHKNIGIGTKLEVKKHFSFDKSLELKIQDQPAFNISEQLAANIYVAYDATQQA
ncbi:metal-dependent transcriptional regulator [Flavihumibacter rivuli]|uniref:metal-dependent transcriptional regulator n=1 Tax=Flavihumibacter rivuli TaxID=2838156 RepID=UPI001BDF1981|nr:metal-dependent transcriptional regulator [Flavihumibacter rivuli]ULQ57315.1 metal-dependent transcriptional regulator [Flavihumibacter rivuli]